MSKLQRRMIIPIMTLLVTSLACGLGGRQTTVQPQQPQVNAAIAQTLAAQQNLPAPATQPPAIGVAPTTETGLVVPPPVLSSPQPTVPMINVTVDTNCRYGPSPDYHIVGALTVGQKVQVHGKNDRGDWWYIENPKRAGEFCWVWGQYAQVEGDQAAITIVTPPPVYFTAAYETHADCEGAGGAASGGVETFIFVVVNIGSTKLESASISVVRKDNGDPLTHPDFPFETPNEPFRSSSCGAGSASLQPGSTAKVSVVTMTPHDPTPARATIRLCTQDGLGGYCYDRTVEFTIG